MAIKNVNGNYLKITRIDDGDLSRKSQMISWELWSNGDVKQNPSDFDKAKNGNTILPLLDENLNTNADANLSIKNNRVTIAYKTLKETDEFKDWVDC